jgi:cell division protein FtsL
MHYTGKARRLPGKKLGISLILVLVLVFLSVNFFLTWRKNQSINKEIDNLQDQISEIESGNSKLGELIKYFNSNAFIEEKARSDLGLKKPGEKVVMIPESLKNDILSRAQNDAKEKDLNELSNQQKWLRYFFK